MSTPIPTKPTSGDISPNYAQAASAQKLKGSETKQQPTTTSQPKPSPTALDQQYAEALAKPVSSYERKTKGVHPAMRGIYDGRYSFEETAEYHDCTVEELGTMFAVFGMQAMEIAKQQGVSPDTAYRAMALNKDGYSGEIEKTLPKAFHQKRAEAERGPRHHVARPAQGTSFRKVQGISHSGRDLPYRFVGAERSEQPREKLPLPKLPGSLS